MRFGTVYLVGAGPGDPELITLRGRAVLEQADAILHDELAPRALLAFAKPGALIEYVGKRGRDPNAKQLKQAAIDARIIELAKAGKSVVRLKGGDPFLFGRGSEEAESLVQAGIPFEIVPGVSSAIAAAAYAGISLTHRDFASSVALVSGTTRSGAPFDFHELAGLRGTIAIFMGLSHVSEIAHALVNDAGRAPNTPVAIVSSGTRPNQRVLSGTLADIGERAKTAALASPALIIVGEVVSLRDTLAWFDKQPLFGKRVLVTRASHQAGEVVAMLRRNGADPIQLPLIELVDPPDSARVQQAIRELASYDVVAFTSENGVARFFCALDRAGLDARAFRSASIAAIGEGTARALERRGLRADLVPSEFHGEGLASAVLGALTTRRGQPSGARVLVPRAQVARDVLPNSLREAGCHVDVVPVYETKRAVGDRADVLRDAFAKKSIDVVMLTSSSIADALVEALGGRDAAKQALDGVLLASIGAITTRTAESHGLTVGVTASTSTTEGLLEALRSHFAAARENIAPRSG